MTAKKDKKARRLARKRKVQRRTPSSGQQVLLNRVRASQHLHNTQVMVNPAGTEKMSEVILRFAAPFKDNDLNVAPTKPWNPCKPHKVRLPRNQAAARACRNSSL
jgi:hypothetical protein